MKKALILVGAIAAFSFSQASELWWTVADTVSVDGGDPTSWTTAKLYASNNGYNFGGVEIDSVSASDMSDWSYWESSLGDKATSAYSFYVELYNSSSESLGKSYVSTTSTPPQGATPYNTLSAANAIYDGNLMNPTATAYSFTQFTTSDVIPEPSSGLMMLLGMVALGLKRKRV